LGSGAKSIITVSDVNHPSKELLPNGKTGWERGKKPQTLAHFCKVALPREVGERLHLPTYKCHCESAKKAGHKNAAREQIFENIADPEESSLQGKAGLAESTAK
jgi:hypothetical protein